MSATTVLFTSDQHVSYHRLCVCVCVFNILDTSNTSHQRHLTTSQRRRIFSLHVTNLILLDGAPRKRPQQSGRPANETEDTDWNESLPTFLPLSLCPWFIGVKWDSSTHCADSHNHTQKTASFFSFFPPRILSCGCHSELNENLF